MSTSGQRENIRAIPTKITISVGVGTKKKFDRIAKKIHAKTTPPNRCPLPDAMF